MTEGISPVEKAQSMAGFTVIFLIGIGVVQVIIGEFVSKSVALTANGIDCIGDGFVSAIVWVGLQYFRRPADKKFHYGYYKIENFASIAAAMVMVILAAYIIFRSYSQFVDPHEIEAPLLGIVVALIAALVAWGFGIQKYKEGRESNMSSVRLEAVNTIKDGVASFLAVVALILSGYGFPIADALVGFIIAGIILSIGFATIKESSYFLADACDNACIDRGMFIKNLAEDINGVERAHDVKLRRSGPVTLGEMEIEVYGDMSVREMDNIKKRIQKITKKKFPDIEQLTVTAKPSEEQ